MKSWWLIRNQEFNMMVTFVLGQKSTFIQTHTGYIISICTYSARMSSFLIKIRH